MSGGIDPAELTPMEPTPVRVEPNRSEFDLNRHDPRKDTRNVVSFEVPRTLPEARSAYCSDPTFQLAVDVFCEREGVMPEQALNDNLQMLLTVEGELLTNAHEPEVTAEPEPESVEDDPDTVTSLKQEYLDGEIDTYEFEERIGEILEREGIDDWGE